MNKRLFAFVFILVAAVFLMVGISSVGAQEGCNYGFNVRVSNEREPSWHPLTTVVVRTDVTEIRLENVEDTPGQVTTGYVAGSFIVDKYVINGPDGVNSIDIFSDVSVECAPPTATPTEAPSPTAVALQQCTTANLAVSANVIIHDDNRAAVQVSASWENGPTEVVLDFFGQGDRSYGKGNPAIQWDLDRELAPRSVSITAHSYEGQLECGSASATVEIPPRVQPTQTPVPPTATLVPPTATPIPPTPTAIPPTATAIPPTPMVVRSCKTLVFGTVTSPFNGYFEHRGQAGDSPCVVVLAVYDTHGYPDLSYGDQTLVGNDSRVLNPGETATLSVGYDSSAICNVQVDAMTVPTTADVPPVVPNPLSYSNQGPQSEALLDAKTYSHPCLPPPSSTPEPATAVPTAPASEPVLLQTAQVCEEPSVFLRFDGTDTELRVLTDGGIDVLSMSTTNEVNDVDPSLSPNGEFVAWARQSDANGLLWEIREARFEDLANSWVLETGNVRNPAVNDHGSVAYEDFDETWNIQVRDGQGVQIASVKDATQPFWINPNEIGFVQDDRIRSFVFGSVAPRNIQTAEGGIASQGQVLNDVTVYSVLSDGAQLMAVESSDNPYWGAGSQPAINRQGEVALIIDEDLWVFDDDGTLTRLVNLETRIENPVWYCNRTLFFESDGVIYATSYVPNREMVTKVDDLRIMAKAEDPVLEPSFSAHTLTRPELQRTDWNVAEAVAIGRTAIGAVFGAISPAPAVELSAPVADAQPVAETQTSEAWVPKPGETWSHKLLELGFTQHEMWEDPAIVELCELNNIPLRANQPVEIPQCVFDALPEDR